MQVAPFVRFSGQAERDAYFRKMDAFPDETKRRLFAIQEAEKTDTPQNFKHVSFAVFYARIDAHIRWLNEEIVRLLRARNLAEKAGDEDRREYFGEQLDDLHDAIDRVVEPLKNLPTS